MFSQSDSELIEPLYIPLPRGEFVKFKVRSNTFKQLFVKSGDVFVELENDGSGLFTGEVYIVGTEALLLTPVGGSYSYLLLYETELSPNVDAEPTYPRRYGAPPNVLYSPLLNPLKIGKSYEFKIKCKTCGDIYVKEKR